MSFDLEQTDQLLSTTRAVRRAGRHAPVRTSPSCIQRGEAGAGALHGLALLHEADNFPGGGGGGRNDLPMSPSLLRPANQHGEGRRTRASVHI